MQRKVFAQQLLMLIRKSGMRQIELAGKVGLSSAAISQFVHGVTLPTARNMNAIFDVLKTPPTTRSQMLYLLMLARAEPRDVNPEKPLQFMSLRANRKLSLDQVAARTSIPVSRLMDLEQQDVSSPTREELRILADFYGVDLKQREIIRVETPSNMDYEAIGAPQITLNDMLEYNPEEPVENFARRNIRNFVARPFEAVEKPVVVQAYSDEVGFRHNGLLQIVVAGVRPEGFCPMELRLYKGGIFRLWQPETVEKDENMPSFENSGMLIWALPVIEVILQPLRNKIR